MSPALNITLVLHPDTKHIGWQGLLIGAGHPGGGTGGFRHDASDGDKDPDGGILPQPPELKGDVFEGAPI